MTTHDEDEDVCVDSSPDWQTLLNLDQRAEIEQLLTEFSDRLDGSLGEGVGLSHEIDTGDHVPVWSHPHRIAPAWKQPLKDGDQSWLEQGSTNPSSSPWSSPVVPVRKPDGSLCLCVHYRGLNEITTPDPYSIPKIDDLIDQLGETTYLSKIDLNIGFLQKNSPWI